MIKNSSTLLKNIYYISLIIFLLLSSVYLLNILYSKFDIYLSKKNIQNIVMSNKIIIDQEVHRWTDDGLEIDLFIRNSSDIVVKGEFTFNITLDPKGLEKEYVENQARELEKLTELMKQLNILNTGEAKYQIVESKYNEVMQRLDDENTFQAIRNYINRGYKFLSDSTFEPVPLPDKDIYSVSFNKKINLNPNEIVLVEHNQIIPPSRQGYLVKLEISDFKYQF